MGTPPAAPPPLPTATSITLQSEQGDAIGQGKSYQYSASNALITVTAVKNRLVVEVKGDEQWTGVFQTGGNASELAVVLSNLDLARAAQLLLTGDAKAPIHCLVANLAAENGVMGVKTLVVDTSA